jgi:methanogenic corrinoid protein MtbC1
MQDIIEDPRTAFRDRYLAAQLAGERRGAIRVIDQAVSTGMTIADIRQFVIQEAQREIGRLWQEDRVSIAQEHMATAISQLALAHLYLHAEGAAPKGRKILVAGVEGELHDFPARLVADALDLAGYEVRFLGASVPVDSLLSAIDAERPDLVAFSVTMTFHAPALRSTVRRVRELAMNRIRDALRKAGVGGGSTFHPES